MKRITDSTILLLLMAICPNAFSQDPEPFAKTITDSELKEHLYTIASPEMQGRETATEGQRKAATYLENEFKKLGLKPGWNGTYQQPFPVYRDSLVKAVLNVNGDSLKHGSNFLVTNNSGSNISVEVNEILFVGYGLGDSSRNDYKGLNANGKIVMAWHGAPTSIVNNKKIKGPLPDYNTLQNAAKKNGAIALIIVQEKFTTAPVPRKGRMYVKDFRKDSIPNTFIVSDSVGTILLGDNAAALKKQIKDGAPATKACQVKLKLELEKSTEHLESTNVIGILEGTDKKDEAIVITAHYDHLGTRDTAIYYGADDDGSGTASILEIAEAFTAARDSGMNPKRSIVFMEVSGEEKGLWGSDYYSENPVFPLDKTSVNINIDMIGRIEKGRKDDSLNYIYVVGDNRLSSDLRPISEKLNDKYHKIKFDYKYNDPNDPERIFYRSDHYNFAKHGVPAIFYFSGLHDDYHRPTDTPDKIRYDLLSKRGQMIFYPAWEMANREQMLKRDLP